MEKIYLNEIYIYYKELFTEKQQMYFDDYYLNDLSLSEIAENYGVSRNAVHNQLKIVEEKILYYEEVLGLKRKKEEINSLLKNKVDENTLEKINEILQKRGNKMFDRINYMDDTHVYFGIKEGAELKTNLLSAHVVIQWCDV